MMCSTGPRPLGRVAALMAGVALLACGASAASAAGMPPPPNGAGVNGYELDVGMGKSQVLETPGVYTDLMVGDPKIADVVPLTTHSVYVVGKSVGSTSLSIYGPGKRLIAAVDVVVDPDIQSLRARLHELVPDEHDVSIHAAAGSLVLSGTVSSPIALHQVTELADSFDPGKVINMLGVEGTQQVQLEVRFVEMERDTAKAFSVTIGGKTSNGATQFSFNSGGNNPGAVAGLAGTPGTALLSFANSSGGNLSVALDALETKGLIRTLAEPTLVAMSGDTASFLAGGEIPIPQAQAAGASNAITVALQPFGISLAFTPTILGDGMINLVVKPEVSSIDFANGITESGITIPGLKVRRADTTVELRDGESFVIAGLLSDTYSNAISQFPFLGDLPVLGALFRSPNFQSQRDELVVVVTPHLVVARKGPVALPTDHFTPPSDYELFLFGMLAGQGANMRPEDRALMSQDPSKGGIEGPYGHVLY